PGSERPPGKLICPAWSLRCAVRRVNRTVSPLSRLTKGTSTAAGRISRSLRQRWPSPEVTGLTVRASAKRERTRISSGAETGEFILRTQVSGAYSTRQQCRDHDGSELHSTAAGA